MSEIWIVVETHRDFVVTADDGEKRRIAEGEVAVGPFESQDEAAKYMEWSQKYQPVVKIGMCAVLEVPKLYSHKSRHPETAWSHPMCDDCWSSRNDATPYRMTEPDEEKCCYCGVMTSSGIYFREHPNDPPFCLEEP
jgi:hypothetical protein